MIRGVDHRIGLKPGAVYLWQHPYKAEPFSREREKAEAERMNSMGIIELSLGEWACPVFMVPPPDGSARFCNEYAKLKLMIVKNAYPMIRMDECIESQVDARVFSTLN